MVIKAKKVQQKAYHIKHKLTILLLKWDYRQNHMSAYDKRTKAVKKIYMTPRGRPEP
jgi:hypothetical protein